MRTLNRAHGRRAMAVARAGVAVGTPAASNAASSHAHAVSREVPGPGPSADPGFPTFVHTPADQAAHPDATQERWYTVGHIRTDGHK